jgi:hypothetical protein
VPIDGQPISIVQDLEEMARQYIKGAQPAAAAGRALGRAWARGRAGPWLGLHRTAPPAQGDARSAGSRPLSQ